MCLICGYLFGSMVCGFNLWVWFVSLVCGVWFVGFDGSFSLWGLICGFGFSVLLCGIGLWDLFVGLRWV